MKAVFEGREKVYCWQDGFFGYEEKPLTEWEWDPDADPMTKANQLEEMGKEAVKMAKRATCIWTEAM